MIEKSYSEIARSRETALVETSDEAFDRVAFAARALEIVRPVRTRVAICEGSFRVRVESGRRWGGPEGARWAIVSVPPRASRRAIVLAIAELAGDAVPYAFDVLLGARSLWAE